MTSYLGGSIAAGTNIPKRSRVGVVRAMDAGCSILINELCSQESKVTIAKCFRKFDAVALDLLAYNLDVDERCMRGDMSTAFLALDNSSESPLNQFFEKMEDQGY